MPRRIFMVRDFTRFVQKNRVGNDALVDLIRRADLGIVDADLGGGLVKLRLARPNEGRSGGYRTIVAYRAGSNVFFLYGFPKNERENIYQSQLKDLRDAGRYLLDADERILELAIGAGELLIVDEGR